MKSAYFILLLILLLPTFVYGVGISGGDLDIETTFVPNSRFRFDFIGIANKLFDGVDYYVYVESGGLKPYIEFEQERFDDLPRGASVPIVGYVNFPDSLPPPSQGAKICFTEECPQQGSMCGRTAACATVSAKVPQEGKYPMVSLSATNVNQNDPVTFTARINNVGKETIDSCTGFVKIIDMRNKSVGNAEFDKSDPLSSFQIREIKAVFNTVGVPPGNYSAKATIDCDGIKKDVKTAFRVGTLNINIVSYPKEIESGGIKRFVTKIESVWNDPIDVHAEIQISGYGQNIKANTATYRLNPWQNLDTEAFLDTSELEEKEYDLTIDLLYQGKNSHVKDKIQVVAPMNLTPVEKEVPAKEGGGISTMTMTVILVIVVILLTVVNIFLAVYRKKKD